MEQFRRPARFKAPSRPQPPKAEPRRQSFVRNKSKRITFSVKSRSDRPHHQRNRGQHRRPARHGGHRTASSSVCMQKSGRAKPNNHTSKTRRSQKQDKQKCRKAARVRSCKNAKHHLIDMLPPDEIRKTARHTPSPSVTWHSLSVPEGKRGASPKEESDWVWVE